MQGRRWMPRGRRWELIVRPLISPLYEIKLRTYFSIYPDRAAIVPISLAAKSGLTEDQVQVSPKYGGGFPANVEGLHHLHCLNLLRKSLYYSFEHYHELGQGAFKNDDRILKFHISMSSCFFALAQVDPAQLFGFRKRRRLMM